VNVLITEKDIVKRVSELAEVVARDSTSRQIHVLFVLKGAFVFCADFIRALSKHDIDVMVNYVIAKSYAGAESTGKVKVSLDVDSVDIKDKEVLLVEDIIDTGRTLTILKEAFTKMRPRSFKTLCLLDKPSKRIVEIEADYVGFEIPDKFVVGYGLDWDEKYRYLPFIAEVGL
jgi:hypoxanthine phosphoribosyltransferase